MFEQKYKKQKCIIKPGNLNKDIDNPYDVNFG
jgi:hypothetical protein